MYENFGAITVGSTVTFNLFFPDNTIDPSQYVRGGLPKIKTIKVTGDFQSKTGGQDWDFTKAPSMVRQPHLKGWLYVLEITNVPDGFYQYKYFAEFENGTTRWCSDPCSKYGGDENENSGFVIGGQKDEVVLIENRLPTEDLIIYEMMLDDFTAEYRSDRAPLDAVLDKLDYLQGLGINAIEFMPWTTWPAGEFSWGYDPVSFFSVEYTYYNDDTTPLVKLRRLQKLINELHKRNIHVIMDGVFNHTDAGQNPNMGFAYFWLYQETKDCPYIGAFGEDAFFNEFNFGNNCTDEFIIDICTYWISAYGIDGIRFDYVKGFYVPTDPGQGIGEIIAYLKKFCESSNLLNMSFTLELLTDNRYDAINDTNQIDASGCWFDPLMWEGITNVNEGKTTNSLMRALNAGKDFKPEKRPVIYIENHDHSTITQACGGRGQWWKTQPLAISLLTISGAVFIHNGQEFGEEYWFPEAGSGRVMRRPLRWERSNDAIGKSLYGLYNKLINIRKNNPVLTGTNFYPDSPDWGSGTFNTEGYGADTDKGLVIYHRWGNNENGQLERYIIALNFAPYDQTLRIPFSENGQWTNLLDGNILQVRNYAFDNYLLGSHWGAIFKMVV